MDNLTFFQITLLENLLMGNEVLRFGHSEPVQDLIQKGLVKQKEGLFVATSKVTKSKLKKALEALEAAEAE